MMLGRLFGRLVMLAMGAVVGLVLGHQVEWPLAGALMGTAAAALIWTAREDWRALRLTAWLRRGGEDPPPDLPGRWGDLSYQIEKALRRRERELEVARMDHARFIEAFQATPNGVMLLDNGYHMVWCNRVAADHLGLDPHRDERQQITNLVRAPVFVDYLQGGPHDDPILMPGPRHAGTLSILLRRCGPDRQLLLIQDVSAREQADAMRREFVAHVSHEIRTPLTVLSGFVETMQSVPVDEAQRQRLLQMMQQQSDRMQSLVSDLLVLARLEGSPRPPLDRWIDLDGLIGRVADEARTVSAGRHALEFPPPCALEVAGHESELHSAVGNLVHNALRYTPEGGCVGVTVRTDEQAGVLIEVQDSGIGIAREHIPRLTQRFYRVDPSRSRETGGTGLGLAIVKHAVQRHGGELLIDSELGRGSRFSLRLPPARVRPCAV